MNDIFTRTKVIQDCENTDTIWIEVDGIRMIYRAGELAGWYNPNLPDVLEP